MKKLLNLLTVAAVFTFMGCDANKTDRDSADGNLGTDTTTMDTSAMNTSTTTGTTNTAVTDTAIQQFVQKTLSGGMMEVALGNMAASNAQNARVKNFGAMMVADHTQAGNELKQMAGTNSVQVPGAMLPEHQKHVDMMNGKTGKAFDKAYMDMMVTDHKKDISEFEKAAGNSAVQSYKDFAKKTLPTLRKHLDSAQAIRNGM